MRVHVLGEGWLTWNRAERVTDRYGGCYLLARPITGVEDYYLEGSIPAVPLDWSGAPIGTEGDLVAVVIKRYQSHHIGDLFRGFSPRGKRPGTGEIVTLGHGLLARERRHPDGSEEQVVLLPLDDRRVDWLDPATLYSVHESHVRLEFRGPDQGEAP